MPNAEKKNLQSRYLFSFQDGPLDNLSNIWYGMDWRWLAGADLLPAGHDKNIISLVIPSNWCHKDIFLSLIQVHANCLSKSSSDRSNIWTIDVLFFVGFFTENLLLSAIVSF